MKDTYAVAAIYSETVRNFYIPAGLSVFMPQCVAFFSVRAQCDVMSAGKIFPNRLNGCDREFNVLLPAADRAADSRLLDSMPRLASRSASYGPLNRFRNTRDNCLHGATVFATVACFLRRSRRERVLRGAKTLDSETINLLLTFCTHKLSYILDKIFIEL